jgi:programmed cell death 6-interacting protein
VLQHLVDVALPLIRLTPDEPDPCSPDLYTPTVSAFIQLSLAQAQECFWQKAVHGQGTHGLVLGICIGGLNPRKPDRMKDATIARLASKVSDYYSEALAAANTAKGANAAWPFSFPPVSLLEDYTLLFCPPN